MATVDVKREPTVADVDQLIDENGMPIALPENSELEVTGNVEETVGATGPTGWWRYGVLGLVIVAAILLFFQLLMGNPGTGVVPGTPVTAPQQTTTP
ncbi:MAG: hypothetical protein JWQ89_1844 [Devosia sp.]|uniref:hypothetical protein n=1 Tax=Devosia sp. TaxID=1871048 RepID=UPI002607D0F7|nr:hypothetical protein [Devosia sp.]MDB5540117.1 hypothetical protein [Devosia sp.]